MILQALNGAGGAKYLQGQAKQNPAAFMGLVGKILPTQVTGVPGGAPIVITTGILRQIEADEDAALPAPMIDVTPEQAK